MPHAAPSADGVVLRTHDNRIFYIATNGAPSSGQRGYITGCIWIQTDSADANNTMYINEGSESSSTWDGQTWP